MTKFERTQAGAEEAIMKFMAEVLAVERFAKSHKDSKSATIARNVYVRLGDLLAKWREGAANARDGAYGIGKRSYHATGLESEFLKTRPDESDGGLGYNDTGL